MASKILLPVFLFSNMAMAGIIGGGGTPPQIEIDAQLMKNMRTGIDNGELILLQNGTERVYLEPQRESLQAHKMVAQAIPNGQLVTFYVPSESQAMASKVSLNFARAVKASIPGLLPVPEISITEKPVVRTIPRNQAE